MKALLIYPEIPETFWSFKYAMKIINKKASSPPLGLLTLASLMPNNWDLKLIDLNVNKMTDELLEWADIVLISSMIVQKEATIELINKCSNYDVFIVVGGPLFTEEYLSLDNINCYVLNEAEITFPLFLEDLRKGELKKIYRTTNFSDMTKSPCPMWELVNFDYYDSIGIQFSRGCPHDCEFCSVTSLFGHKPRIKTADQILQELDKIYSLGWKGSIFFVDDNFIGNMKYVKSFLLPKIIKWRAHKKGISFHTQLSMNIADDEEAVNLMVEAGFTKVFVGIETPEESSLAECNKYSNQHRNLIKDINFCQKKGLEIQGGFIVGFDHDPVSIFKKQIEFIQESAIITAMVGILQALPGTALYNRLQKEGRLQEASSGDNVDGSTNIIPVMGLNNLQEGYKMIMKKIYSPSFFYQRIKRFLRIYRKPEANVTITFKRILIFLRSVFYIGILGKERVYYWDLIFWTLVHRPKLFTLAITYTVYGQHFRKVCEKYSLI